MPQSNELRVFISSTFRDLHEEREHLVKKIFPEIRALCRQRGVAFTEVDLRWGLTDDDVGLGRVIRTCLEEVDKCRPYFIGITGDRYGFVPTYLDIQKDPSLLELYPWIEDAAMNGMSITEMEAQYAVLGVGRNGIDKPAATRAKFYFRRRRQSHEDEVEESDELRMLEAYQARIEASGAEIEKFRDPGSLGEMIFDDLATIVKRDFANAKPPTPLEEERSRHEAFSLSRRRAYIANPTYIKRLNEHVASDDPPLVVYAESGSGKSSLFAYWADQQRRKNPEAQVIEHYVGIGASATDHYAVIRHICMEINERFGRDEEIPSEPAKLETALGQWLGYADHELIKRNDRMVVILDGLNQLQGSALGLKWIPDVISPSIRLVLSSTVEATLVELEKRGWSRFGMQALGEAERETIVVRYLAEYHKSLNAQQIKRIGSDYKCGHPLFLKTVLEELRLVGRHEELDAKIASYLETTGTEDLFQRVLERIEDDYTQRAVRDVMSLLSVSRSGLDEREISELTGISRLKIATMVAGLDYHLVRKEGRLTFFHDYLRRAVENRYLSDEGKRRAAHQTIAEYFQGGVSASIDAGEPVSVRMASELTYQLRATGDDARLSSCLTTMPTFLVLYEGETVYEVLRYWLSMPEGIDVAELYRKGLSEWKASDAEERNQGIGLVSDVLSRLGKWGAAIDVERERLANAIESGRKSDEAASHCALGRFRHLRSEYADALDELGQAVALFTALGDSVGIASAIGLMGLVHVYSSEYDLAIDCLEQQLRMSEEAGNKAGVGQSIGNMGLLYYNRGDYDRALECYGRALSIAEELGDRNSVSRMMGNMGSVYSLLGESDRALECFERQLRITQEAGDRTGFSIAMGSLGSLYAHRGEYDRALECLEQELRIAEELGDRRGLSRAVNLLGRFYRGLGNADLAIEHFERQLRIDQEAGDRAGVGKALLELGAMFHDKRREYDRAIDCFERSLEIAEELGDRYGASYAIGNLGVVYHSKGDYDRAMENARRQLSMAESMGDRHGIAGALRHIGRVHVVRGEYDQAIACHERQLSIAEELAHADTILLAIMHMGELYVASGECDRALECYQRFLDVAEQLGEPSKVFLAIGCKGTAHRCSGDYDLALESLYRAAEGHRSMDNRKRLKGWLKQIAEVLLALVNNGDEMPPYLGNYVPGVAASRWKEMTVEKARSCAEESIAISDEMPTPGASFSNGVLLAAIEGAEGRSDLATKRLTNMRADASNDEQRAELHYRLWKLGDAGLAAEALSMYEALCAARPTREFQKRLEELRAAGEEHAGVGLVGARPSSP